MPGSTSLSVYAPPGGGSVYVVVYGPGGHSAETPIALFDYLTPVPAPTIGPDGGAFTGPVSVTISGIAPGDDVYYNLSNALPTLGSVLYSGPFTVSQSTSVTAAVYDPVHGMWSLPASATFVIQQPSAGGGGALVLAITTTSLPA